MKKYLLVAIAIGLVCFGFQAKQAQAATGDIMAVRIVGATTTSSDPNSACNNNASCDGWVAEIDIAGLNASGTFNFGLGTNNNPTSATVAFTVTSLGFTATGATTTIQRTIYGTDWVRMPYPNATLPDESTSTGIVTVRVSLSDFMYASDTNITATIGSGFYTQGGTPNNATTSIAVTNNSTLSYPKTIANWSYPGWTRITGSTFTVRAVAFNRSAQQGLPVRVVKFTASDQHGDTTSTLVTMPTIDSSLGDASKITEYIGTLSTASFHANDLITINFAAYPWVGDTGAVMDTSDGVNSQPTPLYAPIYAIYDAGTYGTAAAVVSASTGNDSTCAAVAESAFSSSSPPVACATINKAAALINAYNNANYSRNDAAGTIYLQAGNYNWTGASNAISATASNAWNIITPFPGVSSSSVVINGQSGGQAFGGTKIKLEGLTINVTSSPVSVFSGITYLWFDHDSIRMNGTAPIYNVQDWYMTDSSSSLSFSPFNGGTNSSAVLVRGNNVTGSPGGKLYTVIGNTNNALGTQEWSSDTVSTGPTSTQPIFAYNTLYKLTNAGSNVLSLFTGNSNPLGAAVVQNLFEFNSTFSSAIIYIAADDTTNNNVNNVMLWYNTLAGQRTNRAYDNEALFLARTLWSERGNLEDMEAIKSDTYTSYGGPSASSTGNWSVLYGVGRDGVWNNESASTNPAGSFQMEFGGINSYSPTSTGGQPPNSLTNPTSTIGYVNWQAESGVASGTGGGNYELKSSSPVIAMVPGALAMLPYDLAGNARNTGSNGAAGAYEYTTFTLGGTISGLTGTVVLQDNSGDNLSTSTNGTFAFATPLNSGASYNVTVLTQPSGQTCTVSNGYGTVVSSNITNVSLSCASAPSITSFSASPSVVASAGTSTLSWNITNASSVAITPGSVSTSTLIGSTTVNPTSTTLYTITATNANGTTTATTSVSVATAPTAPGSFTVGSPTTSTLSLAWASSTPNNGATISFYSVYRGAASTTISTFIATTTNPSYVNTGLATSTTYWYDVTAQDSVGNVSASSTNASATTLSGITPSITSFSASPSVVASAGTSTLSWNITNASSVAITPGSVSTSTLIGSTTVNPTSTTLYTITATNANGTTTATTSVSVATAPTFSTSTASSISTSTVTLNGTVTSIGNASATVEGFDYGTSTAYGLVASSTGSFATGTFSQNISGLSPNTTYHFQAFATNVGGTGTSTDATFTTNVASTTISNISSGTPLTNSATITWTTDQPSDSLVDYGTSSAYTASSSYNSTYVTSHSVTLTGLSSLTTYHFEVLSSDGILATSSDETFTTASAGVPTASNVTISGTTTVGQLLTGSYSFSDPNNKPESGSTYQWFRAQTSGGSYTAISDATSTTYTVASSDIGHYLRFQVTPASLSGTGSPVVSSQTAEIMSSGPPTATNVSISGTSTEGNTLTGNYTYFQADGVAEGASTYQWLEASTASGTYNPISGATGDTYALGPSDVGQYVEFQVTPIAVYPPATGTAEVSAPTGAIAPSSLPVASDVSISGTMTIGQTLTGSYTYSDSGSHPQASSTYAWFEATSSNGMYSAISNATATTYTLGSADVGNYLKFQVTPVSTVATGTPVQSNASTQVQNAGVPTATSVTISGTSTEGQTLTGNYTYGDPNNFSEASSTYHWLEASTASGTYANITGATSKTYTLLSSDVGKYLEFRVTPVASVPPTTGSAVSSAPTSAIAPSSIPVASNVTISGAATVGQTLTGSYVYSDAGGHPEATSTYEWLEASTSLGTYTPISGATSLTYVPTSTDDSDYLEFQVTPVSTVAQGAAVQSAPTSQVSATGAFITSISAGSITTNSAVISWTTNVAADSTVSYGTTASYGSTSTDPTLVTAHSITLSSLAADTLYHFAVTSAVMGTSTTSGDNTFTTNAVATPPVVVNVGGGGGGGYIPPFTPTPTTNTTAQASPAELLASLESELQTLLAQAAAQGITIPNVSPSGNIGSSFTFTRNLTIGMTGNDVHQLQLFLVQEDIGPAAEKLATHGTTKYFGSLTKAALIEFQKSVGITPDSGFFGPITRAWVSAHETVSS